MIRKREDILQWENSKLAPYAVFNSANSKRQYPEEEHDYRIPFQRDKDRIIHSAAFRRLEYKTQVFIATLGDNYRTRLTHTMEVAALARTVAENLGLNTYLAESIALAHDLGHAPFGHAGQEKLAELMKGYGGFEHNKQSLRVVTYLEKRYASFPGLNLCIETLIGIMKHGGDYQEKSEFSSIRNEEGPSLEALITDDCDSIAYNTHDLDDGLEAGILHLEDLMALELWKENWDYVQTTYPNVHRSIQQKETIRRIMNSMVIDFIETIHQRIEKYKVQSRKEVGQLKLNGISLVGFSEGMETKVRQLKKFLKENLYNDPTVNELGCFGQEIIEALFYYYLKNPNELPKGYLKRLEEDGLHRVVCDYIAGMTDRYAEEVAIEKNLIQPFG